MVIDVLTPFFAIKSSKTLPKFSTSKLPERFGLFIIIVLGEGIVGTINGITQNDHIGSGVLYFGVLGIAITFSLWWIYFDFIGRRVADHKSTFKQFLWGYLHMPLVVCFVVIGSSLTGLTGNIGDLSEFAKTVLLIASGSSLIIMGGIETLLQKTDNEPTHYTISPLLKLCTGIGLILMHYFSEEVPSKMVMGMVLLFFIVNMVYSLYVWFTQNIDENIEETEFEIGSNEN